MAERMREAGGETSDAPRSGRRAPVRALRPPRAAPADAARVTRAEINLAHVRHNLREIKSLLEAEGRAAGRAPAKAWPVLKADGYGHGAAAIATTLEQAGVDGLCVALLEEGIELRNAGLRAPILVMGGYYGRYRDGVEALIDSELTPVVYDVGHIESLAAAARYMGRTAVPVHLKIDTGMARLGVRPEGLAEVLRALRSARELVLDGLMTHLACADASDLADTRKQLADFDRVTQGLRAEGWSPRLLHAANTAAMLRLPTAHFDVVRPGLAVFGVHPCPQRDGERAIKLKPVMRVLSEVVSVRELPAGAAIGYGHSWRAARASRIATIPMGYADGLSRALSNKGAVLIGGMRAPIVGTVSMDLTMVDVTDLPGVAVRDEVVLLGEQRGRLGRDVITADAIADTIGTIAYECLTAVSRRVPRFYRHP
jgi:alanine racemase